VDDTHFMRRALELAELGRYSVSPNPMVGCVIVRDGVIIGEGWHRRAGEPHAEIEALRAAGDVRGATMYVTLEPCAHEGRTPPCADAVIAAGIARAVIAMLDPHDVAGGGAQTLRERGIAVVTGVLEDEARRLNEIFIHAVTHRRPFVLLKAGMTLDGKLATVARDSRWITSEAARERSMALREEYDAIAVGSGTVRDDDPQLTRRLGLNGAIAPWTRVLIDARGEVPATAKILTDGQPTVVFTASPQRFRHAGVVPMPATGGRVDLEAVLDAIYARGHHSLLVEGGGIRTAIFSAGSCGRR
jgi:diaminohydroxyphosphoribosylaminopyrimidine deaminase/5-amino-6-(5-phosphoribosylamino)uracil reductase